MKNEQTWKATKYQMIHGSLRASTDPTEVKAGSKLIVNCIAKCYDEAMPKYVKGRLIDLGCGKAPLFIKWRILG
jgi:hypothetical protein